MEEKIEKTAVSHCTMCNLDIYEYDPREMYQFDLIGNFGSKYDLTRFKFSLCPSCFDKVMDYIIENSKESPVYIEDVTEIDDYPPELIEEAKKVMDRFLKTVPIHRPTEKDLEDWD